MLQEPHPETRFCTGTGGTLIAYAEVAGGAGLPLVVVHDWPASFERDSKEPRYRTLVQEICRDRTVVRFDRRGVGASERHEYEVGLDVTEVIARVPAPALVLHRDRDRNVPIRAGRAVAGLIPDARFVVLEGDVAYLGWEPHETARLIGDFLNEGEDIAAPPAGVRESRSGAEEERDGA